MWENTAEKETKDEIYGNSQPRGPAGTVAAGIGQDVGRICAAAATTATASNHHGTRAGSNPGLGQGGATCKARGQALAQAHIQGKSSAQIQGQGSSSQAQTCTHGPSTQDTA